MILIRPFLCKALLSLGFSVLIILFSFKPTQAQDWSFAIGPGITQYAGDVNNKQIGELHLAINGEAWYRLTDNWQIKSGMSFYQIGAHDSDTTRLRSFKANNFELYTSGMYYFKRGFFTPFIYAGIGATTNNPMGETRLGYYNLRDVKPEAETIPGITGFIPAGIGLEYEFSPVLSLVFDLSLRYTFTDKLDGVSKSETPTNELSPLAKDYYAALSDGISRRVAENENMLGGSPGTNDMYSMFSVKIKFTPSNSIFGCIDPYKYGRPTKRFKKRRNFDPI